MVQGDGVAPIRLGDGVEIFLEASRSPDSSNVFVSHNDLVSKELGGSLTEEIQGAARAVAAGKRIAETVVRGN